MTAIFAFILPWSSVPSKNVALNLNELDSFMDFFWLIFMIFP